MLVALYVLPAQYGLITFSLPIIQFIALFTDMGLASALIRQPHLSREEAGAALSFSLVVAAVGGALLALLAFPIERASALPGLGPVLAAFSLAVVSTIIASVPRALMERALRYQSVASIEGVAGGRRCARLYNRGNNGGGGVVCHRLPCPRCRRCVRSASWLSLGRRLPSTCIGGRSRRCFLSAAGSLPPIS